MKVSGSIADPNFRRVLDPNAKNPFSWRVLSSGNLSMSEGAGGLLVSNSAPGTRLVLVQTVAFPSGLYRFRVNAGDEASHTNPKVYISWACNGPPPYPILPNGNLLETGQEIRVSECDRQQIGLWVSGGGASARLQSIALEKIG